MSKRGYTEALFESTARGGQEEGGQCLCVHEPCVHSCALPSSNTLTASTVTLTHTAFLMHSLASHWPRCTRAHREKERSLGTYTYLYLPCTTSYTGAAQFNGYYSPNPTPFLPLPQGGCFLGSGHAPTEREPKRNGANAMFVEIKINVTASGLLHATVPSAANVISECCKASTEAPNWTERRFPLA